MYKTIIIDDEPKCTESLLYVLKKNCPAIDVVATAVSGDEGYEKILQHNPDIIFLDVEMPYGNGFELLSKFNNINFEIIFVTAYENFAIKAIKAEAVDYILKPFTEQEIIIAAKKAAEKVQERKLRQPAEPVNKKGQLLQHQKIAVPTFDGLIFININDIIRCEANDHYTQFYLADKQKVLVCKSLSDYELLLGDYDFHRIHQSHLVNLSYIQKYIKGRGGYVIMQDGANIEVAARKKTEFLDKIFK